MPDAIDVLFDQYDESTAGCALAVMRGGVVDLRAYGRADLERCVPNTPTTLFNLGSAAKQFTALGLLLLEADGLLSLEDDVRSHVPELHDFGPTVRLRHLLHHTSGLRGTYPDLLMLGGWRFTDHITQGDCLRLIFDQRELSFEPGSEHLYVNANYVLLAELISRVADMSLAEFSRERIFEPLGMDNSLVMDDASRMVPGRALGYYEEDGAWHNQPLTDTALGSTNVYSTARDMARWMANFRSGRVGGAAVLERLREPGVLNDGTVLEYAGGLQVGPGSAHRGRRVVEHGGQHGGYCTSMYWFPDDDLGIALLFNHYTYDGKNLLLKVADLFLEGSEFAAPPAPVVHRRIEVDEAHLKALSGTFFDPTRRVVREVPLVDGALIWMGLELVPVGPGVFTFTEDPKVDVRFDDVGVTVVSDRPYVYGRVDPIEDGTVDLGDYVGRYESPELQVVWNLAVDGDRLRVKRHKYEDTAMKPLFGDIFLDDWSPVVEFPWEYLIEFERSEAGVTGLRVSGSRARGVWFEKIE